MIYSHNYNNLRNSNDNIIDDNDSSFDIHKKFCFQKIKEILEKFPEKIIDDIDDVNKICGICLEDYVINDKVIYLPCFHFFHKNCIIHWFENKPECPLCKNKI